MDIEKVNAVLSKAIVRIQEDEIDGLTRELDDDDGEDTTEEDE